MKHRIVVALLVLATAGFVALPGCRTPKAKKGKTEVKLANVTFPRTLDVGGQKLVLNGVGVHQGSIIKTQKYVIGLYTQSKSSDASKIINSSGTRHLAITMKSKAGAKRFRKLWGKRIAKYGGSGVESAATKFFGALPLLNIPDTIGITIRGAMVRVSVKGKKKLSINSAQLAKGLLSIWLGDDPVHKKVKKGLLGGY